MHEGRILPSMSFLIDYAPELPHASVVALETLRRSGAVELDAFSLIAKDAITAERLLTAAAIDQIGLFLETVDWPRLRGVKRALPAHAIAISMF